MPEIQIFDEYNLNDGDHHTETLDAFIARMVKIRDKIPAEKRDEACVDIWCFGDYAKTYADVIF